MHGTASKNGTAGILFFVAGPLGSRSLLLQISATVLQTVSGSEAVPFPFPYRFSTVPFFRFRQPGEFGTYGKGVSQKKKKGARGQESSLLVLSSPCSRTIISEV